MDMGKDTVGVVMNVCVYTDVQWSSSSVTVWKASSSLSSTALSNLLVG